MADAKYKKLHELLRSAGLALQTLSAAHRDEFESTTNTYLQGLHTIDVGLRRQIYGLEEANIIPAEKKTKTALFRGKDGKDQPNLSEGAMGKLDIGWLNSRSSRVGRDMEAELWQKARVFLEAQEKGNANGKDHDEEMTT
jgi:hypothetical protein